MSTICKAIKYICTVMIPDIALIKERLTALEALPAQIADLQTQITSINISLGSYASKNTGNTFLGTQTFNPNIPTDNIIINIPVIVDDPVNLKKAVTIDGPVIFNGPISGGGTNLIYSDPVEVPEIIINGTPRLDVTPTPTFSKFGSGASTATGPDAAAKIDLLIDLLGNQGVLVPS